MSENFDKLTNFVGNVGNKITETAGKVAKKADYVLDVVKDKGGNAVGLIKDKAGNVVQTITNNVDKVAKYVALTGFILLGGVMMGCNTGVGSMSQDDFTKPSVPLENIDDVDMEIIDANSSQAEITAAITQAVKSMCREITDMRTNIASYRAAYEQGYIDGLPSKAFLDSVDEFHTGLFSTGQAAINTMVGTLGDNVGNKDLFTAYVNALRGMSFIGVKNNTNSNYTATFSLGSGTVSVGSLIETVNTKNPAEDADYPVSGTYPIVSINSNAVKMLPSDYYAIGSGIITEMVNFEKFLAFQMRVVGLGKNASLSREALNAITAAFGGIVADEGLEDSGDAPDVDAGVEGDTDIGDGREDSPDDETETPVPGDNGLEDAGDAPDVAGGEEETETPIAGEEEETLTDGTTVSTQGGESGSGVPEIPAGITAGKE
jgi:hypothetical protein